MGGRNQVEVEPLNHRGHEGRMEVIGYRKPATAGLRQVAGTDKAIGNRPQEKQNLI